MLHVRKVYFEGLFMIFFVCPCYALVVMSTDEINTIFQAFIDYIYEGTGEF